MRFPRLTRAASAALYAAPLAAFSAALFVAATLGSGCAPAVAVMRSRAGLGAPRAPSTLRIYMDEKSAPAQYQELGLIIVNTHVFIPVNFNFDTQLALAAQSVSRGNARDTRVFRTLVRRAARLGADALIIKGFSKGGVNLSISAVAIRTQCFQSNPCVPTCPPGTAPAPAPAPAPASPAPTYAPPPAPMPPAPVPAPSGQRCM